MEISIQMQKISDSNSEMFVSDIYISEGSSVKVGDPLIRVETDKAIVDISSPFAGEVLKIFVAKEEEIAVGATIIFLNALG